MDEAIQKAMGAFSPGSFPMWAMFLYFVGQHAYKLIKAHQDERKLSLEDKQANREGFTKQVESLQEEVSSLRTENRELRKEYDAHRRLCTIETEQLRDEIVRLEGVLAGMFRKVAAVALKLTRGEVDKNAVNAIFELASEAQAMSDGRDVTAVRRDKKV